MNTSYRLGALVIAIVLLIGPSAWAQGPELPDSQGDLTRQGGQQIDEYVQYWLKALAGSTAAKQVIDIRTRLAQGYNRFSGADEFQVAYVDAVATHGKTLLAGQIPDDDLKALKEINFAIAVQRMGKAELRPLADAMIGHGNPAVRHFGWGAYVMLRPLLLTEGGKPQEAMYAAIAGAGAKEADPLVLSELMTVLRLPPEADPSLGIDDDGWRAVQGKFFQALQGNWTLLCKRVKDVDGLMSEAAGSGVAALALYTRNLGDQLDRKAALQMAINMTWCAGKAYDLAWRSALAAQAARDAQAAAKAASGAAGDPAATAQAVAAAAQAKKLADGVGKDPKQLAPMLDHFTLAISANDMLLKQCEQVLSSLAGKPAPGELRIRKALASDKDRGADVRLAVLAWVDELKKQGLASPKDVISPPPTTAPATKPAE